MSARASELSRVLLALRAPSQGRYARVSLLDALIELADDRALARACLRGALEHVDHMGSRVSELELDRVRTLRDRVEPALIVGPPIDPVTAPSELERRALAALDGMVRGPIPPRGDPDHGEALALTTLAHLIAGRHDVARSLLDALTDIPSLPTAAWAVLIEASRSARTRRAASALALRLARELPRDAPRPLLELAPHVDPRARIALLLAAFDEAQPGATEALREALEQRALSMRDAGDRAGAIAMLETFERALETRDTTALRRMLR